MSRSSSKNGGLFSEVNFSTAEMTIPLDYVFVGKIPISKNGPATNICDHCHATNTFEESIEHRHIGQNDVLVRTVPLPYVTVVANILIR